MSRSTTIARADLIDAVEYGIANAENTLTDEEKTLLRDVVKTAPVVARARATQNEYAADGSIITRAECPLYMAGLWHGPACKVNCEPSAQDRLDTARRDFYQAYDRHTKDSIGDYFAGVLHVQD